VHDAVTVAVIQGIQQGDRQAGHGQLVQILPGRHDLGEGGTLDVLHGIPEASALLLELVDLHDVRVVHGGGDLGFVGEPGREVLGLGIGQDFESLLAVEVEVQDLIHGAGSPLAQHRQERETLPQPLLEPSPLAFLDRL